MFFAKPGRNLGPPCNFTNFVSLKNLLFSFIKFLLWYEPRKWNSRQWMACFEICSLLAQAPLALTYAENTGPWFIRLSLLWLKFNRFFIPDQSLKVKVVLPLWQIFLQRLFPLDFCWIINIADHGGWVQWRQYLRMAACRRHQLGPNYFQSASSRCCATTLRGSQHTSYLNQQASRETINPHATCWYCLCIYILLAFCSWTSLCRCWRGFSCQPPLLLILLASYTPRICLRL
jgi:hypothetical protein